MATRRKRRAAGGIGFLFALVLSLSLGAVGSCFGRIWYQQQCLRQGQRLQNLEAENLRLARRHAALRAKIAHLHSPDQLRAYASLRMAPPARERLVRISMAEMRNPLRRAAMASHTAQRRAPAAADSSP